VPIFFSGIFPFFGFFLFDMAGIFMIAVSILCLSGLAWGVLALRPWAWWGALIYVGLLTVSVVATFPRYDLWDILSRMRFPPTEVEILQGVPFHGTHLALGLGMPLLITLGLLAFSKRYFKAE
jgi:hypothetical protein